MLSLTRWRACRGRRQSHNQSQRLHCGGQQVPPPVSSKKLNEESLALTLVGISILFIVCQSVKLITDLYEVLCEKDAQLMVGQGQGSCASSNLVEIAISLANLSTCVNSAANFLIYMLRGKKFRDLFVEIYCCRHGGEGKRFARYGVISKSLDFFQVLALEEAV